MTEQRSFINPSGLVNPLAINHDTVNPDDTPPFVRACNTAIDMANCGLCNAKVLLSSIVLAQRFQWTVDQLTTQRQYDTLPCVKIKANTTMPDQIHSRLLYDMPPDIHGAECIKLNSTNVSFMLLLGDVTISIHICPLTQLQDRITHTILLQEVARECFYLDINIRPTQLAVQIKYRHTSIFVPFYPPFTSPDTIFQGRQCHRFIVPIKISRYKVHTFRGMKFHKGSQSCTTDLHDVNKWPSLKPPRSAIDIPLFNPALRLPPCREIPRIDPPGEPLETDEPSPYLHCPKEEVSSTTSGNHDAAFSTEYINDDKHYDEHKELL